MKHSPKGLFTFRLRSSRETAAQSVEKFIIEVEAWANRILDEASINVNPREAWKLAAQREHADEVHFALKTIGKARELRTALRIAADKSGETMKQSLWCAFRMMEFCADAYAGATVGNEKPTYAGIRSIEGGEKGGAQSRKVTPEHRAEIRRVKAATPRGRWTATKQSLARKLRLGRRTIERVASEK